MTEASLISSYDALLADLDGVVYAGPNAIPGAVESLERLADIEVALAYITNNASRSAEQVAAHLRELGAPATAAQVFGSAFAGAELLATLVPAGSTVLVTGSQTLVDQVKAQGLVPVTSAEPTPDAVIQGFDPNLGWKDLAEAAYAVAGGAVWVATNTDLSIPQLRGIAPGNGSLVAAVTAATGSTPAVAGKPEAALFTTAAKHLGVSRPLVVGDRLDTDILGGNRARMDTALVLTGVDTVRTALAAVAGQRPKYLLADLEGLYEPYPEISHSDGVYRCGASSAMVDDGTVHLTGDLANLDTWRAACSAWWSANPDPATAALPALQSAGSPVLADSAGR
ncbi:HAD-IIA family hydrolase [Arthrobacter sp. CAL618]|uniref:HAD-IIA family hydrolase n=1 Tax=Arthrobacter sp. CAL618 TaxID=1055770 RepID=UPI000423A503|nr:HAD-IIA family hydrolase [Arthrobacter sp. CAL618]